MNLKTAFLSIVSILVIGCCPVITQLRASDSLPVFPSAKKGLLDLRQIDLSKHNVPLSGEWAIYWGKIFTPKDSAGKPTAYVDFPKLWSKTYIDNLPLPVIGYATYSLTVLLPAHNNKLALEIPDTYDAYRLFINDEMFANSGNPDSVKEKAVPKWIEKTVELTQKTDTLHLILQVANFWHSKGGPYKEIVIGNKETLFYEKEKSDAFDLTLTGCLFMGGLFFFGLFLF
ncbi:MAG: hypothetical protein RLZZ28_612, partial [Bacteroidota bacterium]